MNGKEYIDNQDILDRIGCTGDMYAIDCSLERSDDMVSEPDEADVGQFVDDDSGWIDNSHCTWDFEAVEDGYHGDGGYMHGDIKLMRPGYAGGYPEVVGIFDSTGMYRMQSQRAVWRYHGESGRAKCIAIPQCKMMNSTTMEWFAIHKVYTLEEAFGRGNGRLRDLGPSWLSTSRKEGKDDADIAGFRSRGYRVTGRHVPFDLWCVVGAVFGKALRVWRSVARLDWDKMPSWMMVTVSEMYEAMCPGCSWDMLAIESKTQWRDWFREAFKRLNKTGLGYDLPDRHGGRHALVMPSILESTWVERRAVYPEEIDAYGEGGWYSYGFKVHLKGSPLFDFCWRWRENSPSLVQLRQYDFDANRILGRRGWIRCMPLLWSAWLISYRNYWKKRGGFRTCDLVWSKYDMRRCFEGHVFETRDLSTPELERMMRWHTPDGVLESGMRRPSHIAGYRVIKRGILEWWLHPSADGETVIVKDKDGRNMTLATAGVEATEPVKTAMERMEAINKANSSHTVTLDGRKINTSEVVIYRVVNDSPGKARLVDDENGRCYSRWGGVQGLRKEDRLRLRIDGRFVCEVDYSALHPSMLYALNGIDCTGMDMYDLGPAVAKKCGLAADEMRAAAKMMMLRVINAKNIVIATRSFKKAWNVDHGRPEDTYIPWLFTLYDAICQKHWRIKHEFCTGCGVRLMNLDGELIREVGYRLAQEGICSLAVHDSVVVERRHESRAKAVMIEEYARKFSGAYVKVKVK